MVRRTSRSLEYRCYLLDGYGQIVWRSKFLAPTEDEAIATARTFFEPRMDSAIAFELWRNGRCVYCENDPQAIDELVMAPSPNASFVRLDEAAAR